MTQTEPGRLDDRIEAQIAAPRHVRWVGWRSVRRSALTGVHMVEATLRVPLCGAISARGYSFIVAALAFVLTKSMTIPAVSVVVGAILLRRDRWMGLVLVASFASAIGGMVLYLIFHHLGWSQVAAAYPDLVQSRVWADATRWISDYGTWALFAIAASPLPQTPALIFTAVSRLPAEHVFLALFLAKLLKYGIYGFVAAKFPCWFWHAVADAPHHRSS
jgi:membrane protein YqaA with SNARE-associated domain